MTAASEARHQVLKQDDALDWIAAVVQNQCFWLKRGWHLALEPTARGGSNHEVFFLEGAAGSVEADHG